MLDFASWRQLAPAEAARALVGSVAKLSARDRGAILSSLATEEELVAQFSAAASDGPLRGVPYFLKDVFDVSGLPTLAGSTFLSEILPTPDRDGAMVQALAATGAVFTGKTHLHEFAFGLTGENPHYGDCEHPHFPGRTSGGSSSGSAAAVAAGIVPFAIGTDTGGSIRVPAAFCGLFGFRMVPHHPWITDGFPLSPSYDTAGWFTRTAGDMRLALDALLGEGAEAPARRGCWLELPGLDADVRDAFRQAAGSLVTQADRATRLELQRVFAPAPEIYGVLGAREAWEVHEGWMDRYSLRYDPAVRSRLEGGQNLKPAQIEAAEHGCAQLDKAWEKFFGDYDYLVLPASPCTALTKAQCTVANRLRMLSLTAPVSLAGLPALVLPVTLPSGLSTGLQIVARDYKSIIFRDILTGAAA